MTDGVPAPVPHDGAMTDATTTDRTAANLATIQGVYAAFGRGDLDTIGAAIAETTDWSFRPDVPGAERVPMFANVRTRDDALAVYFGGVADALEFHTFVPRSFFVAGDDVVVAIDLDFTVRSTGRRVAMEEIHHFTLQDGQITRYRPFLDTATVIAAFTP